MNAKLTSFLMTAGAVVVGVYAYHAIAGEAAEPAWFTTFKKEAHSGVYPEFAGRRGRKMRRR